MRINSVKRTSFQRSMLILPRKQGREKLYSHNNINCGARKSTFHNSLASIVSADCSSDMEQDRVLSPDDKDEYLLNSNPHSIVEWYQNLICLVEMLVHPRMPNLETSSCDPEPTCERFRAKVDMMAREPQLRLHTDTIQCQKEIYQATCSLPITRRNCLESQMISIQQQDEQTDDEQIQMFRNRKLQTQNNKSAFFKRVVVCTEEVKKVVHHMKESQWTFGFKGERINVSRKRSRKPCPVEATYLYGRDNIETLRRQTIKLPHFATPVRRASREDCVMGLTDLTNLARNFQSSFENALRVCKTSRRVQSIQGESLDNTLGMRKATSRKHQS